MIFLRTLFGNLFLFLICLPCTYSLNKLLIPNPMTSPEKCGREGVVKSAVCDPQNLLAKSDKDLLEGKINEFDNIQLAIAIIKNMEVASEDLIDETSRQYAVHLHNTWGVGDAQKQNGILIFLSIKDRVVYISRGNGFKDELNSIVIDLLVAHMRPFLQEGNYGKALEAALIEINLLINDSKNSQLKSIATKQQFFQTLAYGLMACVFGGFMYYAYRQQQYEENLRRGEKALNRLLKDVSNESDNRFKSSSCPICLEEFHYPPTTATATSSSEEDAETKSPINDIEHTGPQESSSSAPSTSSTSTDPLRPMALHCGHTYCYACLETYLKDRNNEKKCPICRVPVDPDTPVPPPRPQAPQNPPSYFSRSSNDQPPSDPTDCHRTGTNTSTNGGDTRFRYQSPEFAYRMNRMRYLYPTVMTADTYERMNRGITNQSASEVIQAAQVRRDEVNRQLSDINLRRAQQRSGSGGSRHSWGGGSSGGGGGGRW